MFSTDLATVFRELGPLALAAGLGMAALYVLMPRPRAMPRWLGAALGGAALVALALVAARSSTLRAEAILFYAFSGIAITAGGVMITRKNAARAALSFALVILSTCGLFLLNAAPFLMAGTIIIYAGAIVVTFLFVIMLAQPEGYSDADARSREPLLATLAGFFLLSTMLFVLRMTYDTRDFDGLLAEVQTARAADTVDGVRQALGSSDDFEQRASAALERLADRPAITRPAQGALDGLIAAWNQSDIEVLRRRLDTFAAAAGRARQSVGRLRPGENTPLSEFAGTPANRDPRPMTAETVAGLGRTLFSDYLLAVELGGTLLLIATIGAIAITHRTATGRRAVP